jgi:hypothetical protein
MREVWILGKPVLGTQGDDQGRTYTILGTFSSREKAEAAATALRLDCCYHIIRTQVE